MQFPVVIEKVDNNGYRARTGELLALSAEGGSAEEAVSKLQVLLQARIDAATRLVFIEVPTPAANPWLDLFGRSANDPDFPELLQEIKQARLRDAAE
jgi:hypothetical protein